ncbi:MAG: phosphoribosylformylglycinamidine synthase I [Candidatus Omnitrophica bacterium]|nr:phosphoribosylformylglycinamidine synthase I [Candidatus Omnitrophota bacterium]
MKNAKTLVLRTAGTNCDRETAYAFEKAGSVTDLIHINRLIGKKDLLSRYHILAIPGGFTYGDDVASGKILANELRFSLKEQINAFVRGGKLIIGICNGFQVLVKMGLLPGITGSLNVEATLGLNDNGVFTAKWIHLKTAPEKTHCVWAKGLPGILDMPIAHAEGKFIPRTGSVLKRLRDNGQIVFRYTDSSGTAAGPPYNPNGSVDDIAGICDPTGRILGMMPHPERHITPLHHPNWRRHKGEGDKLGTGMQIFRNGVKYIKDNF